jgi:hypothetical protein
MINLLAVSLSRLNAGVVIGLRTLAIDDVQFRFLKWWVKKMRCTNVGTVFTTRRTDSICFVLKIFDLLLRSNQPERWSIGWNRESCWQAAATSSLAYVVYQLEGANRRQVFLRLC